MRRRTILLSVVLLLVGVSSLSYFLIKHQPDFYERAVIANSGERFLLSADFANRYTNLTTGAERSSKYWHEEFTTEQINSFLQHDYLSESGEYKKPPSGFHDVRIQVEDGMLRIGCRYKSGVGTTIVTLNAKMWLIEGETNLIAVELTNLRAGALPVPRQVLLDHISEAAAKSNFGVTWRHIDDNPVAIIRFQADKEQPTAQIDRLEVRHGRIIVAGRTTQYPVPNVPAK